MLIYLQFLFFGGEWFLGSIFNFPLHGIQKAANLPESGSFGGSFYDIVLFRKFEEPRKSKHSGDSNTEELPRRQNKTSKNSSATK